MPTYQRATVVPAPFETVWEFYDGVEELEILTPDWLGMDIERVIGPDGAEPDGYLSGTEIHLRLQPLGRGSLATNWHVEIVEREVSEDRAVFVDEQIGDRGPYDHWRHTHRFVALDDETLVHDRVDYRLPFATALPLASPLLAGMLWHRHRRTRRLLAE